MSEASGRSAVDHGSASEHVSPELALVDPELAEKAREQLPDLPRPAPPPPPARRAEKPEPTRRPRRRRRRVLGVAALTLFAVAGAAGVGIAAAQLLNDDPSGSAEQPSSAPAQTAAPPPAAEASGGAVSESSRTFGWVPVERAAYYRVSFFRGDTKIFETWPKRPPLVMPARWTYKGNRYTLGPGVYRWVVRPGFGPRRQARYGAPIVDASLVVRS